MLAESDLDMKSFLYIKDREWPTEEYVQEDHDYDDDDPEEFAEGSKPANGQLIGRDQDGKFKHHENYVQLMNKINE
jgi:hypothetical protein